MSFREVEDGTGWGGLVSTKAEREQEAAEQRRKAELATLQSRIKELEADAERYRTIRKQVRGNYDTWGKEAFFLPEIKPVPGTNIMRGSVAQHFDAAIDRSRSGEEGEKDQQCPTVFILQ